MAERLSLNLGETRGRELCIGHCHRDRREEKRVSGNVVETCVAVWKRDVMYVRQCGSNDDGREMYSEQCGRDKKTCTATCTW